MDDGNSLVPWALLVISWPIFIFVIAKLVKRRIAKSEIWDSPVVAELREQMKVQEERVHEQMDFFVNFPEIIKVLTGAMTIDEVATAISRGVSALLGSKRIAIFLAHSDNQLRLMDGTGFPEEQRGRFSYPLSGSPLLPLLKFRGVSSTRDHPEAERALAPLSLAPELSCSIWYAGRLLGLIVVSRPGVDPEMGVRIMAMLADLASVSLHAAGLVADIRKKAERDALTGLPNRRTLMARVDAEVQRSEAYQSKFCLVMIDVDNFKHYNDTNGHAAGDTALKMVGSLISKGLRRTDMAARYGGEEFTLVLQNADKQNGLQSADRVRQLVATADFPFKEKQPLGRVSVSLGLACYPDDARDPQRLFKAADSALYVAKESGRDRVIAYDSGMQAPES